MNASSLMMLYGALVAVAGVIGAVTSGSAISAGSGVIFSALAIAAGFGLRRRNVWVRPLGFAVSGFLLLFFAMRVAQGQLFSGADRGTAEPDCAGGFGQRHSVGTAECRAETSY